ncbi:hypothetical protein [Nereida sp. MMG025]|uniref:hypothetical protein n=1 Tax=Nereida sp. MMG025 TaxID=2909981 RepID=UPI001F272C5B|nr:hypothetical protein [Nereida sp. MMG025]MCF6445609.1 hypothetical protein [Nereida sp. MMG025]
MTPPTIDSFLKNDAARLAKGPIAMIFVEDQIEVNSTIRHHLDAGFKVVMVMAKPDIEISDDVADRIVRISYEPIEDFTVQTHINKVIAKTAGQWLYYCYNGEYLFYPFSETRSVGEMLAFHTEERRDAMLTYVVDLYAGDLNQHPNAVNLEDAFLDRSGYYALARKDPKNGWEPKERQLDFFGGVRWRFEEHIPFERRKIDRIGIFRAKAGLEMRLDHTLNDEEYNTYACPWHNNITAAIMSFRTAKALKRNPGSTFDIETFKWRNSTPFEWHSQQLMDLGLMEPGQWF